MSDQQAELREAIAAGREALSYLDRAVDALDDAIRSGWADMFGIPFIDLLKYHRIDQAKKAVLDAQTALTSYRSELGDVTSKGFLDELSWGTLPAFDILLDNVFADYMVLSKLKKGKEQVLIVRRTLKTQVADLSSLLN